MAEDLKRRMEGAGVIDSIGNLQDIAEEMFARFYMASGAAAEQKAMNLVLVQEVQRLEEENGRLRTELDNEQGKLARARDEVEKCAEIVKNQLRVVEKLKEENRVLSEENYKLETQIRQMVAGMAKNCDPSGGREAATSPCAGEAMGAKKCPKCGSMDTTYTPRVYERICNACGEVYTYG